MIITGPRTRSVALAILALVLLAAAPPVMDASATPRQSTWDFEGDSVGEVPRGCDPMEGHRPAVVTDASAQHGRHSLDLTDDTGTVGTGLHCRTAATTGIDLSLALHPSRLANGMMLTLVGRFEGIAGPETPVFKLWIKPDGAVFWFDGLEQDGLGWTQIGGSGTIPINKWSTLAVRIGASQDGALVYTSPGRGVGPGEHGYVRPAEYVGPAGPIGVTPVDKITGFRLSTAVPASGVDSVQIDDVRVRDGRGVQRPPRNQDFIVGQRTVIDSTGGGFMQMPNSATTRGLADGRQEVLVTYPTHGDATHDTGTAMASSTDGGRNWTDVSERNPYPGEQSFYLSSLSNGDLLAVNYHTFMTPGSGNRRAQVPTAVSSDGGRTWVHREGQMTTPRAMRPISDATSRPGEPLGGFVLVHSVVEAPDGTLYQAGYGYYASDERFRSVVLASTDRGKNWMTRSTIAVDGQLSDHPRYEGFGEPALALGSDGSLIAVMRTGNYQPLYRARSTDQAHTWSVPEKVTAGADGITVTGVFPDLELLDNGVLVLWAGRPGQFLLVSADGTGEDWSAPTTVDYRNSGNGAVTPTGRNRMLVFGDRGADWTPNTNERKEIWGCPVTVRRHPGKVAQPTVSPCR